MPRLSTTLALAGLIALTASAAVAQDRAALESACKADFEKLCAGVAPGGGRIIKCLQENADKLSAPCKSALAK